MGPSEHGQMCRSTEGIQIVVEVISSLNYKKVKTDGRW
jgi:hypothetical protein